MRRRQALITVLAVVFCTSAGLALMSPGQSEGKKQTAGAGRIAAARDASFMRTPSNEGIPPVANRITIKNLESQMQVDRPTIISRFFAPGEIVAGKCAAAVVGGSPVATQCDAKTHWPDGSLQHAMLTFKASYGDKAVDVEFVPAETPMEGAGLDVEGMLGGDFDFSAILEVETADGYQWVNAREMLKAGMFRYWLKGPLVTQVIVEEQGVEPGQDFLAGGHRSIHPMFILTFYQGHRGVRVEAVNEIAWFNRLQTVKYTAKLWTGAPGREEIVYNLADYTHLPRTRWRRDTWSGPALGKININHNLAYLVYSRILPNFDLSRTVGQASIDAELRYFDQRNSSTSMGAENCAKPGGSCMFYTDFGSTGGRGELGFIPRWDVRYLYTFDQRLYDVMIANANVSGHVPIHVRESAAGKVFHTAAETPADANARIASVDARPCFVSSWLGENSCGSDRLGFLTQPTMGPWATDMAHQGAFAFVGYLVTGDWYYLEEMYFWASRNVSAARPGNCDYCRGGDSDNPGIYGVVNPYDNIRGVAWGMRMVIHAATFAPDGSPEKGYFLEKALNTIAASEGRFSIRDGFVAESPEREGVWRFGFESLGYGLVNPFYSWWPASGKGPPSSYSHLDQTACANWTTAPMQNFNYTMFGYIDELGLPATVLRRTMLRGMLNQLANPDYNRYLIDEDQICNGPAHLVFFSSWKEVLNAFEQPTRERTTFLGPPVGDAELGYGYVALAVASFLGDVEEGTMNGREAHKWLYENYPGLNALDSNPKWAIVPRSYEFKGSISSPSTWSGSVKAAVKARGRAVSAKAR
ncbi:MAG TPA: hypothetical protein PLZ95_10220 [Bryobacteraceae bacterium]|nr:hypothetical protein [Bryobacteraceae bacterium]